MDKLVNLCLRNNIQVVEGIKYDKYESLELKPQDIFEAIYFLSQVFSKYIVYGGHLASSFVFGYKQVRRLSSDIDIYIGECSLKEIAKKVNGLSQLSVFVYDMKNQTFFLEYKGIPVTLSYSLIGNFELPYLFKKKKDYFVYNHKKIYCCRVEFLILMKLRRSYFYNKVFGKDYIDISNLFLSDYYSKKKIDFDFLIKILKKYLFGNVSNDLIMDFMNFKVSQFNEEEVKIITNYWNKIFLSLE